MAKISNMPIAGFNSNIAGKIATLSDYYIEANLNDTHIERQFTSIYKYDDLDDSVDPNEYLSLNFPSLNQLIVSPKYRNTWAKGMIIGEATGDYGPYGHIQIKLFNPSFDRRGGLIWVVQCLPSLVDLHDTSESLTGRVWKQTGNRGEMSSHYYFREDGSFGGTYDENGEYYIAPPGPSLGEYLDPAYLVLSPRLPEYELKYGNLPYNYGAVSPGIDPAIVIDEIRSGYSTKFQWLATFNLGDTPHHWFDLGGIVRKGMCYSTNPNPTIADGVSINAEIDGKAYGQWGLITIDGLTENTTYYARGFQEREVLAGGTEILYGEEIVVQTTYLIQPPSIYLLGINVISNNYVRPTMTIGEIGERAWTECGFVYSRYNSMPTVGGLNCLKKECNVSTSQQWGWMEEYITGLTANTKYYIRAYVKTSNQTFYATVPNLEKLIELNPAELVNRSINHQGVWEVTTKGSASLPGLAATTVEWITNTSAVVRSYMSGDGGSPLTEAGVVYSTSPDSTIANTKVVSTQVSFTDLVVQLTGLLPNTTYYARGYAINSVGITYAWEKSFTTTRDVKITNISASNITKESVALNATVDDLKPTDIKKQGFVLSPTNSTAASLVIGIANTVIDTVKTTNGVLTLNATQLQGGTTYYYRPFINKGESSSLAVYGDIKIFITLNNVLKPSVEIISWKSDSDNMKLKVNLNVISDGGDPLAKFYLDIVDEGETLSTTLGVNAIECTNVGTDYYVEFDMTGKAAGTYGVRGYGVNTAGTSSSSFLNIQYVVVGQSMPLIGVSHILGTTGVDLGAYIYNTGNSVILTKTLKLKNLTDNTEEVLELSASQAGLNHIFNHYSKVTPLNSKVFRLELSVSTEYTRDFNEDVNAISFVEFTTPTSWSPGVADKTIVVDLTQDIVAYSKSNEPQLTATITGDIQIGGTVRICGRLSDYGLPTSNIGNKPGDFVLDSIVESESIKQYTAHPKLTVSGKYWFRAFYIEDNVEYTSSLKTIEVLGKDLVADVSQDDVDLNGNVNPNVFAPPTAGNYNGREYVFKSKKWVYNSTDKAWERDYGYSVEDKIADLYDYIDNKIASSNIISQGIDKPVLSTGTVLAPSAAQVVKTQAVIDIEDELANKVNKYDAYKVEVVYIDTVGELDVIGSFQITPGNYALTIAEGFMGKHTMALEVKISAPSAIGSGSEKQYIQEITFDDYSKFVRIGQLYADPILGDFFFWNDWVNITARKYKAYVAKISQTGTAAPTVTVLENTIGDIVWTRDAVGSYIATLSEAFSENTVLMQERLVFYSTNLHTVICSLFRMSSSVLNLTSFVVEGANADDELDETIIEIRVY